jgi:hypothetical protein
MLLSSVCAAADPRDLAGHYYLQGAMEMGSQLLLREDGTFVGEIIYGSAGGYAKGTWQVEGDTLTLRNEASSQQAEDLPVLFHDMTLKVEPNCLSVDLGNGKACYRK